MPLAVLAFAAVACVASLQAQTPAASPARPGAKAAAGFGVLIGRWLRPDGGYVINIRGVDAEGRLDAAYANPNPLPFARAEAARDGKTLKLFFKITSRWLWRLDVHARLRPGERRPQGHLLPGGCAAEVRCLFHSLEAVAERFAGQECQSSAALSQCSLT
jgi:hypothetical protein